MLFKPFPEKHIIVENPPKEMTIDVVFEVSELNERSLWDILLNGWSQRS